MNSRSPGMLHESPFAKILSRALGGSFVLRLVGTLFTFLVGVQLARGLGAANYGVYSLAMALLSVALVLAQFGLPQLITREVAAAQSRGELERVPALTRWAHSIALSTTLLILMAVVGIYIFFGSDFELLPIELLLVTALLIPVIAIANIGSGVLRGLKFIIAGQLADVLLRPMFYSVLLLGFALLIGSLTPVIAVSLQLVATILAATWVIGRVRRLMGSDERLPVKLLVHDKKKLLSSTVSMALNEGMRVIQSNVALIMLGFLVTSDDVGNYKIATSVYILMAVPISLVSTVISPYISSMNVSGDFGRLQRMLAFGASVMLVGVGLLWAPLISFGDWLVTLAFGAEFLPAVRLIHVLALGLVASAFCGANSALLTMTGRERAVTRAFFIAMIVQILLVIVSVPTFGVIGAAAATTCSYIVWNVLMWISGRNSLQLDSSVVGFVRFRS